MFTVTKSISCWDLSDCLLSKIICVRFAIWVPVFCNGLNFCCQFASRKSSVIMSIKRRSLTFTGLQKIVFGRCSGSFMSSFFSWGWWLFHRVSKCWVLNVCVIVVYKVIKCLYVIWFYLFMVYVTYVIFVTGLRFLKVAYSVASLMFCEKCLVWVSKNLFSSDDASLW